MKPKRRPRSKPSVKTLAQRARREANRLLKRSKAGSITQSQLQTGLKEIQGELAQLLAFKRAIL
jgi:hypothetical protein